MTPAELQQVVELVRAQPAPPSILNQYLDPRKVMVAIGLAAVAWIGSSFAAKVDQNSVDIQTLVEVTNKLVLMQEGDAKEFAKRGSWIDNVDKDRKDYSVRLEALEVRVNTLEGKR